jgi:hypothetical protein
MGRRRVKRTRRVRPLKPLPGRADLPPDVAEFMRILDDGGSGYTADASDGGLVWTIRDPGGNPVMEFSSGRAAADGRVLAGLGDQCLDLGALWGDPEFNRQLDSGLVDIYGRPLHPEGRDFFSEHHDRDH